MKLKEGCNANANEIIKFFRDKLPHYMPVRLKMVACFAYFCPPTN